MARAIDADAVKRRAWDIAEAWKDQGRDYEALLLESVVEQIVDTQPTLTPPNEPLTLEELREMDGEPVYVVPANEYSELGKWCVISIGDSDDYSCALVPGVEYWSWKFEGYGEQWLAYRRPPEGEADA